MAFYVSRRKLHPREEEEAGELNIVPYLDIMMNLIMFMLLTMTALITLGVLNVNAPGYGSPGASAGDTGKKDLVLTVAISHKGFFVAAVGGVLPGGEGSPDAPTIGLTKDSDFDFDALTQKMITIKALPDFSNNTKIILTADADLPYRDLVRTMDAVREYSTADGKHPLFFDVSLSAGVM